MNKVHSSVEPTHADGGLDSDVEHDGAVVEHRESFERISARARSEGMHNAARAAGPTKAIAEREPADAAPSSARSGAHWRMRSGSVEALLQALAAALHQVDRESTSASAQLAAELQHVAQRFESVPTTSMPRDESDESEAHHVGVMFAHYKLHRLAAQHVVQWRDAVALCTEVQKLADESLAYASQAARDLAAEG